MVDALAPRPLWRKTLLIITYDEHGGYYDHVPPPAALAPDSIPPMVQPGESTYDGFARYGFRVPSIVVSPYAKPDYVSHVVYDHTSILALVERKWNLPAMTYRDANANDLTDFLDLGRDGARPADVPRAPALAAAGHSGPVGLPKPGPGTIPPPRRPKPIPIKVKLTLYPSGPNRHKRGVVIRRAGRATRAHQRS